MTTHTPPYETRRADWRQHGKCGPGNASLFFPEKGTDVGAVHDLAKQVCAGCPVQPECLSDALDRREPFGVRGGLTAKEREKVLRRDRLPARGHQGNPEPMWRQILRVPERRAMLLELHGRDWSSGRIAAALHTNAQTVNRVLRELEDQAALDAASEAVAA